MMKKALFCLIVLLALSGCGGKEPPPMAGNVPPSSVEQESRPEPSASPAEDRPESSLPPEEESSVPTPAPEESLPPDLLAEETSPLLAYGVVSEDGLTYRNDALGLTVTLPASSTGRPWCFTGKDPFPDVSGGMRLLIQMDPKNESDFAIIQAMPHEDLERIKSGDFFSGVCSDDWKNSRYAFTVSYSRANPYEGATEAGDYQTMLKEIQSSLENGLSFYEPTV